MTFPKKLCLKINLNVTFGETLEKEFHMSSELMIRYGLFWSPMHVGYISQVNMHSKFGIVS